MAQKTKAVKKELNAYTSPSTAEYQNESLNVYAKAPTTPAPITNKIWFCVKSAPLAFSTILLAKWVMVQNKNKIVNPLANALMVFTALAAVSGLSPKRIIKTLPIKTNIGAPGG